MQVQKSTSTPAPSSSSSPRSSKSQHRPSLKQYQQQHQQQQQQRPSTRRSPDDRPRSAVPRNSPMPLAMMHDARSPRPSSSSSSTTSSVTGASSDFSSGRRSSVTSVSSTVSMRSEMSVSSKVSLSKRLRKVFSVSSLRGGKQDDCDTGSIVSGRASLYGRNGSNTSLNSSTFDDTSSIVSNATTQSNVTNKSSTSNNSCGAAPSRSKSFRRRSIASLSNLFHKNSTGSSTVPTVLEVEEDDNDEEASVQENTNHSRRCGLPPSIDNSNHNDSNNNTAESVVEGQQQQQRYGLPTYGSPKLRPTSSSSSVATTEITSCSNKSSTRRRIQFCPTIQVHETFGSSEYDRRSDTAATCQKITQMMAMKIKQELNEYKLSEMQIHADSRKYTHFFL
ncbi:hypothetical protein BDB00DRAFT_783768 [Zychaea mexicana]|uniref:uncharacterized protein n=1 Tax=Zychaea mexicana TaxID=64656 RepID=UPI0022FEC4EC|nr:uncharacterized protein BDB00DRAFT_783768 [Zychaea mexicana]KAI9498640.1 hypothetical protein BDB00DRAFT_783768 [Zychaea mexicana]